MLARVYPSAALLSNPFVRVFSVHEPLDASVHLLIWYYQSVQPCQHMKKGGERVAQTRQTLAMSSRISWTYVSIPRAA